MTALLIILALGTFTILVHVLGILWVAAHLRASGRLVVESSGRQEGVSIIRPVCGIEPGLEEMLESTFHLDHPDYEILFCVADRDDPVVPLLQRLVALYPLRPASILFGEERINANPKLNNIAKGWRAARHDWIVMTDSNLLLESDYLRRLLAAWRDGIGAACSPPVGTRPNGFWAELECAFLNTYEARWQYLAGFLGFGFAQGKTMLFRREVLERAGGIEALGREIAEDAATTKLVRAAGLSVAIVPQKSGVPLGRREATEVWGRQQRWAQLRRMTFPLVYVPEILSTNLVPILALASTAAALDWSVPTTVAITASVVYGAEAALAVAAGWHLSIRSPLTWILRDLLIPVLWLAGWHDGPIVWRGNALTPPGSAAAASRGG